MTNSNLKAIIYIPHVKSYNSYATGHIYTATSDVASYKSFCIGKLVTGHWINITNNKSMSKGHKSKRTDLKQLINITGNNIHVSTTKSLAIGNKDQSENSKFISMLSSSGDEVVVVVPVVVIVILMVGGIWR